MTGVFIKRGNQTHAQLGDQSSAPKSQGTPKTTTQPLETRRGVWNRPLLMMLRRTSPVNTLMSDLQPPQCETINIALSHTIGSALQSQQTNTDGRLLAPCASAHESLTWSQQKVASGPHNLKQLFPQGTPRRRETH